MSAGRLCRGRPAVAVSECGTGLARALIETASGEARRQGLPTLCLQMRVELPDNHATFARFGSGNVGASVHPACDRPTFYTSERQLGPDAAQQEEER
ncbi:hypothetical protein PSA7680_01399 [Pseudoruegeria aquimaris]|uniref:N-acetyltransferase domain-containing protein n=1 Tax=Pseudoruegeria aquimaris TaxID=393663 RepID=A0A1Y5S4H3_9RHOB|nr:hypothetical protein PSA7680_01399 [Pseudoruegeria aquimaris]